MENDIQNVDELKKETDIRDANKLLKNGWVLLSTEKTTYLEDGVQESTSYILGHLKS